MDGGSPADGVVTTWHGPVLELRLDRPARRNALDHATVSALLHGICEHADRAGAIVLTGGDDQFSAGGDVSSMPTPDDGLFGPASRLEVIHEAIVRLRSRGTVTVAAVEGYAIGVAWGLVLACDVVVSAEDAFFAAPFGQRGLAADGGVAWHLVRRLGRHAASRHLLLGERLDAREAARTGLVTRVSAPGEARSTAHEIARGLAEGPTESVAVTRWMCDVAEDRDLATFLREERIGVALAGHGADAAEGRAAFSERREAVFSR